MVHNGDTCGVGRMLLFWGIAAIAAVVLAQNLPDLVRYLKIRNM